MGCGSSGLRPFASRPTHAQIFCRMQSGGTVASASSLINAAAIYLRLEVAEKRAVILQQNCAVCCGGEIRSGVGAPFTIGVRIHT